jgi:hypothetical protein
LRPALARSKLAAERILDHRDEFRGVAAMFHPKRSDALFVPESLRHIDQRITPANRIIVRP